MCASAHLEFVREGDLLQGVLVVHDGHEGALGLVRSRQLLGAGVALLGLLGAAREQHQAAPVGLEPGGICLQMNVTD